jgi:hypothetical protein
VSQADALKAEAVRSREEEERGNAMKALENRTKDSKREMDIMEALDEMRSLKARCATLQHACPCAASIGWKLALAGWLEGVFPGAAMKYRLQCTAPAMLR